MASQLLSCEATSASIERFFSTLRITYGLLRTQFGVEKAGKLAFCYRWLNQKRVKWVFLFMFVSRTALCKGSTGFWLKGVFPVDGRLSFLGLDPTGGKHSCVGVHKQHLDFMCQLVPKIGF